MKTVNLKDISEKRMLEKEKFVRILAQKKGHNLGPCFENWFKCIFMTDNKNGFQILISENPLEHRKAVIKKVTFSNDTYYIKM